MVLFQRDYVGCSHLFHLHKTIFVFSRVGFKGNRSLLESITSSMELKQMEDLEVIQSSFLGFRG